MLHEERAVSHHIRGINLLRERWREIVQATGIIIHSIVFLGFDTGVDTSLYLPFYMQTTQSDFSNPPSSRFQTGHTFHIMFTVRISHPAATSSAIWVSPILLNVSLSSDYNMSAQIVPAGIIFDLHFAIRR